MSTLLTKVASQKVQHHKKVHKATGHSTKKIAKSQNTTTGIKENRRQSIVRNLVFPLFGKCNVQWVYLEPQSRVAQDREVYRILGSIITF